MYTIKNFAENMALEMSKRLAGVTITVNEVTKDNGLKLHSITCRPKESNIAPTMYAEGFYEKFENGDMDFETCVRKAVELYQNSIPQGFDVSFFTDYSKVKTMFSGKLVNLAANQTKFIKKRIIYKVVCDDLALIPIVSIKDEHIGNGTIQITYDHLRSWNITEKEFWNDVEEALTKEKPFVKSMGEFLKNTFGVSDVPDDALPGMYIITSESKVEGAHLILNHHTMDMLCDKCGTDKCIIIPSSKHECIIIPPVGKMMNLAQMVREVNAAAVEPEDILSNNVYQYDKTTQRITIFDESVELDEAI